MLAEQLSRKFMSLGSDSPLEDLIPWDANSAAPIIQRRMLLIKKQSDEDMDAHFLR